VEDALRQEDRGENYVPFHRAQQAGSPNGRRNAVGELVRAVMPAACYNQLDTSAKQELQPGRSASKFPKFL
jgi:hypothetical protein